MRRWIDKLLLRIRSLLHKDSVENELTEELRFHLERQIEENLATGVSPKEARDAATRTIGGTARIKEECRDTRRINLVEGILKDLLLAMRTLKRDSTFTVVSTLTLALGIGATTAIFTVVNGVILRPLPYSDPGRLVTLWETNSAYNFPGIRFSPGNYLDLREQHRAFAQIGAYTTDSYNLTGSGDPDRVTGGLASASLFSMLGVRPTLGRGFVHSDDSPSAERVVILTRTFWMQRFSGNPAAIGTSLRLDDNSHTIIGVMPPGIGPLRGDVDLWLPLERKISPEDMRWRQSYYMNVIARLKKGVTVEQARKDVDRVVQDIRREHPDDLGKGGIAVPMLDHTVARVRGPLLILLGAVGFVLLIACANVANLNLAHTAARRREIAVRLALGASRARVVRQLFTESLFLALAGAGLGLCVAWWGVSGLLKAAPPEIPRLGDIHVDGIVLGFTLIAATAAGIIFGLFPAITGSTADLQDSLKEAGRSGTARRMRSGLVIAEVALALVLMIGAGLMIESFRRVLAVDPGFNPRGLITMRIPLSETKYGTNNRGAAFYQALLERVRGLPGVKSFGAVDGLPFSEGGFDNAFAIDGRPELPPGQFLIAEIRRVDPNYFRTMGISVIGGRAFSDTDRPNTPDAVIISQSLARQYWPNENPVGKRLTVYFGNPQVKAEIVGLVSDVHNALDAKPKKYIYLAYPQGRHVTEMYLVIRPERADTEVAGLIKVVRSAVGSIDPDQPVYRVRTMDELLSASLATRRFEMRLLGIFAALAACLAAVGLYGVLAYSVQIRTREIGIRTALGANASQVFGLVLKDGLRLAAIGLVVGLAGALVLTRVLSILLFEIKPTDPPTFAAVSLLLLTVALAAGYFPARRAARVDPMIALRHE